MPNSGQVVVTGASTGIGHACAIALDARGYHVLAGVRKEEDADRLRSEASDRLKPVILDVTKPADIEAAAKLAEAAAGEVSVAGLINNAGITVNGPMEYLDLDDLRWQFEVNVIGLVAVTQAFLPLLRQSKGRIINVSSVGGFSVTPMLGPYCASKFAVEAISDAMRRELRPFGIEVVVMQPAAIKTKIWEKGREAAPAIFAKAPEGLLEHYGTLYQAISKYATDAEQRAADPQCVVDAVIDALESPKPKTRYRMGDGVGQRVFLSKLPDRWADRKIARVTGH
jgi:NAD(P)-dependent dehydrogenase (short-subunit alcohol dehydrogenase family)